jgi:hypothetical protein
MQPYVNCQPSEREETSIDDMESQSNVKSDNQIYLLILSARVLQVHLHCCYRLPCKIYFVRKIVLLENKLFCTIKYFNLQRFPSFPFILHSFLPLGLPFAFLCVQKSA